MFASLQQMLASRPSSAAESTSNLALIVGESVVVVYADGLGAGPRIVRALSSTRFNRSLSLASLSLESYGAIDAKIPLEIVNFIEEGSPVVTVITVIQEGPPGPHSCIAHELLRFIMANAPIEAPAFTIFILAASLFPSSDSKQAGRAHVLTYNDDMGARKQMFSELLDVPGNLQIKDEFLACLMHLVNVKELPAVVLLVPVHRVSPLDTHQVTKEKASAFEAICHLGGLLAQWLGLNFSSQLVDKNLKDSYITKPLRSEWAGMYG